MKHYYYKRLSKSFSIESTLLYTEIEKKEFLPLSSGDIKPPFYQYREKESGINDWDYGTDIGSIVRVNNMFYRAPKLTVDEFYLYLKLMNEV